MIKTAIRTSFVMLVAVAASCMMAQDTSAQCPYGGGGGGGYYGGGYGGSGLSININRGYGGGLYGGGLYGGGLYGGGLYGVSRPAFSIGYSSYRPSYPRYSGHRGHHHHGHRGGHGHGHGRHGHR